VIVDPKMLSAMKMPSVMTQDALPEVGDDHLRFVEPVVDADIVLRNPAPLFHAGKGVVIRMCHVALPNMSPFPVMGARW
jgi:hypothetical protein